MERVKSIVAGNWKMYKTEKEAVKFIEELAPLVALSKAAIYIAVPFTCLSACVKAAAKTNIVIGAQNMSDQEKGAFTGEISSLMIESLGAQFVLLGHSERRHIFKEDDDFINRKVLRAIKDDIQPILCIGETAQERETNKTEEVLTRQLTGGLGDVPLEDIEGVIIAYEPVWAIGTGKTATPEIAEKAHLFIRKKLSDLFEKKRASKISILYGGSVKPDNISELIKKENIDGVLVGGASLEVKSFLQIVEGSEA